MVLLRLSLLGGFEAALASGAPVGLPTRKAQALIAYCALRPDQSHQRGKLATLLWGETEETNARNSLRQTLFVLRSALGESASRILHIERDTVSVEARALDIDVQSFERLATEGTPQSLDRAAGLYRGDLLEGFVVDEEPFEEWLMAERERLRDLALESFARLLQHQRVEGPARAAIHTARRLLALDPLQEIVHRLLMRLLVQVGRADEALNQYEACRRVLRRELGLEPEAETVKLRDSIFAGLRSAALGDDGGSARPHAFESAMPALDAGNTRPGFAEGGSSSPLADRAGRQNFAGILPREWSLRVTEEARRLRMESQEQRALLQRSWQQNVKQITVAKQLLLTNWALGADISGGGGE